ncbi:hypothetical protein SKAU_G00181990 [Synaphobranchus kaupii]|uniref:Uncharacterized protein n=1 Tax=Synaphobranchus kaupii TaxID=118154 RepID=A0A9Q1IWK1_SYNKA|nr:hypothetical protein SKAU_G00181990 [Synaphobranchus kaupii]
MTEPGSPNRHAAQQTQHSPSPQDRIQEHSKHVAAYHAELLQPIDDRRNWNHDNKQMALPVKPRTGHAPHICVVCTRTAKYQRALMATTERRTCGDGRIGSPNFKRDPRGATNCIVGKRRSLRRLRPNDIFLWGTTATPPLEPEKKRPAERRGACDGSPRNLPSIRHSSEAVPSRFRTQTEVPTRPRCDSSSPHGRRGFAPLRALVCTRSSRWLAPLRKTLTFLKRGVSRWRSLNVTENTAKSLLTAQGQDDARPVRPRTRRDARITHTRRAHFRKTHHRGHLCPLQTKPQLHPRASMPTRRHLWGAATAILCRWRPAARRLTDAADRREKKGFPTRRRRNERLCEPPSDWVPGSYLITPCFEVWSCMASPAASPTDAVIAQETLRKRCGNAAAPSISLLAPPLFERVVGCVHYSEIGASQRGSSMPLARRLHSRTG